MKILLLALSILVAVFLFSCSKKEETSVVPELTAENCKPENIARIQSIEIREKFAAMCLREGSFKPSKNKQW